MKNSLSALIIGFFRCDKKDHPMPTHYAKKLQSILCEALRPQKP